MSSYFVIKTLLNAGAANDVALLLPNLVALSCGARIDVYEWSSESNGHRFYHFCSIPTQATISCIRPCFASQRLLIVTEDGQYAVIRVSKSGVEEVVTKGELNWKGGLIETPHTRLSCVVDPSGKLACVQFCSRSMHLVDLTGKRKPCEQAFDDRNDVTRSPPMFSQSSSARVVFLCSRHGDRKLSVRFYEFNVDRPKTRATESNGTVHLAVHHENVTATLPLWDGGIAVFTATDSLFLCEGGKQREFYLGLHSCVEPNALVVAAAQVSRTSLVAGSGSVLVRIFLDRDEGDCEGIAVVLCSLAQFDCANVTLITSTCTLFDRQFIFVGLDSGVVVIADVSNGKVLGQVRDPSCAHAGLGRTVSSVTMMANEEARIACCSGSSISIVSSTFAVSEVARLEGLAGICGVHAFAVDGVDHIVLSFVDASRLFRLGDEGLAEAEWEGLDYSHFTVACETILMRLVLQVTSAGLNVLNGQGHCISSWKAPNNIDAAGASPSLSDAAVAMGRSAMHFTISTGSITLKSSAQFNTEISCLAMYNNRGIPVIVLGCWETSNVLLFAKDLCAAPVSVAVGGVARSILCVECQDCILVGTSSAINIIGKRIAVSQLLGNSPPTDVGAAADCVIKCAQPSKFGSNGSRNSILVVCDPPAVIDIVDCGTRSTMQLRMIRTPNRCIAAGTMVKGNSLIYVDGADIVFGWIAAAPSTDIVTRSIPLRRYFRLALSESASHDSIVVVGEDWSSNSPEGRIFFYSRTFEERSISLKNKETPLCVKPLNHFRDGLVLVGTAITESTLAEPTAGRVLLVSSYTALIVDEILLHAAVYDIDVLHSEGDQDVLFVVAAFSSVRLMQIVSQKIVPIDEWQGGCAACLVSANGSEVVVGDFFSNIYILHILDREVKPELKEICRDPSLDPCVAGHGLAPGWFLRASSKGILSSVFYDTSRCKKLTHASNPVLHGSSRWRCTTVLSASCRHNSCVSEMAAGSLRPLRFSMAPYFPVSDFEPPVRVEQASAPKIVVCCLDGSVFVVCGIPQMLWRVVSRIEASTFSLSVGKPLFRKPPLGANSELFVNLDVLNNFLELDGDKQSRVLEDVVAEFPLISMERLCSMIRSLSALQ